MNWSLSELKTVALCYTLLTKQVNGKIIAIQISVKYLHLRYVQNPHNLIKTTQGKIRMFKNILHKRRYVDDK